jgi:hypothetical protein
MEANRLVITVTQTGLVELKLPEYAHQQVEIIVRPIDPNSSENIAPAKQPVCLDFIQMVLADPEEDVWNDI